MMMIQFTMQCKIMAMLTTQLTIPRYDNCYPRIDGTTNIGGTYIDFQAETQLQSYLMIFSSLSLVPNGFILKKFLTNFTSIWTNVFKRGLESNLHGANCIVMVTLDFQASAEHYPSLWQVRLTTIKNSKFTLWLLSSWFSTLYQSVVEDSPATKVVPGNSYW